MRLLPLLSLLLCSTLSAAVADMSGSWTLDQKRSRFTGKGHPGSVVLTIEHQEPKLKYSGRVDNAVEGAVNDFEFDGAIDGREYVVKQDKGDRRVVFKRVNDRTVESVAHGVEGEIRSRMTLSSDGRTLERRMSVKAPDGKTWRWVEIYDRQDGQTK